MPLEYLNWRLSPNPDPKKPPLKIPVSPHGQPVNYMDPRNRITRAEAEKHGNIAVFITPGYFFVDLDHHLQPDGTWSPIAQYVCSLFPGAYVEVSQSRTGLHIIARGVPPEHKCTNKRAGIEFYSGSRCCSLTGLQATGDMEAEGFENSLNTLVLAYLKPDPAGMELTATAKAEYTGPPEDDKLISLMLLAKANPFTRGATLRELWEGDEAALADAYPSPGSDVFNRSAADQALACHLAFWTGCNEDRIARLLQESGLAREKHERNEYMRSTVSYAVRKCSKVYTGGTPAAPVAPAASQAATAPSGTGGTAGLGLCFPEQQASLFAGCVYVLQHHKIFTPMGQLLKPEQFKAWYGGRTFVLTPDSSKVTRSAFEAFTESQVNPPAKANSTCFKPNLPPGALTQESGLTTCNTYVPPNVRRVQGDPSPFIQHVQTLVPDPMEYAVLMSYLAAIVQYPGIKFRWCVLLQGVPGNGKTLIARCVAYSVGRHYSFYPKAEDLANKFNAWIQNRVFVAIEDIYIGNKTEMMEALKPMVSNDDLEMQPKGVDQFMGENVANILMFTNHKDALVKEEIDRRYCLIFAAQQKKRDLQAYGLTFEYFKRLHAWLQADGYAIVADFLSTYQITEEFNPATNCLGAPNTPSSRAALTSSLPSLEQEIQEAINEDKQGFRGGFVSSSSVRKMLRDMGRSLPAPRRLATALDRLGFEFGTRASRALTEEGGRPIIYARVPLAPTFTEDYAHAQGYL